MHVIISIDDSTKHPGTILLPRPALGIIFLIVNYAHIVSTLRDADLSGGGARPAARQKQPSTGGGGGGGVGLSSAPPGPSSTSRTSSSGAAPPASTSASASSSAAAGIGKTGATALKDCDDQLQNCTALYVEDQLSRHFPILVRVVLQRPNLEGVDGLCVSRGCGRALCVSVNRDPKHLGIPPKRSVVPATATRKVEDHLPT